MSSENNSLLNLGDLTKPATILIEKISNAIGILYEPRHIVNLAKAQAEADRIKAEHDIEIADLQQRAVRRFIAEETKKQINIESIIARATNNLNENATPQDIEDDWIANFFDKCKLISEEQMQILWSRILAGEANKPGNFSKRTINYLENLDKYDANLFMKICSFTCSIDNQDIPFIYRDNNESPFYNNKKLIYEQLKHLYEIGLVNYDGSGNEFSLINNEKAIDIIIFKYFDMSFKIQLDTAKYKKMEVGECLFTKIGMELSKVCKPNKISDFADFLLKKWCQKGYVTYCDYPKS